jgi:homoserine O-acetyltransferase
LRPASEAATLVATNQGGKIMRAFHWLRGLAIALCTTAMAQAADYPQPRHADWVAPEFRFHTGETMKDVRLHYVTVGAPTGIPVLILHGTAGSGESMLTSAFAGELFGPGQPLDASKYYIILPDALGAGQSARPSLGLRAKFPRYDYTDMVEAQHRLLTEGLGISHVRLILGNSMGGMQTWLWGASHPGFADALVPMASQPTEMASRNWMLRRMLVEMIRQDPAYNNGDYTAPPPNLRLANAFFGIATSGGTLAYQTIAPTGAKADAFVDERLAAPMTADANDFIWQWQSSRGFDASPLLERITVPVLAINSADDERNPPETGVLVNAMKRVAKGEIYLIPASEKTRGHGTTAMAAFWKERFASFFAAVP